MGSTINCPSRAFQYTWSVYPRGTTAKKHESVKGSGKSFLLIVALSSECACFVPEPGQNIHLPLPKTKPSGSIPTPLALASVYRYLTPAVAKTYVVTFRSHNNDRPSKFIVVADNMKSAINMAWEHGGADFQSRFDKSTAQEMKEGGFWLMLKDSGRRRWDFVLTVATPELSRDYCEERL